MSGRGGQSDGGRDCGGCGSDRVSESDHGRVNGHDADLEQCRYRVASLS